MQRPARGGDAKNEGMRYDGGKSKTFLCSGLDRFLVEPAAEQSPQFHGQWSNDCRITTPSTLAGLPTDSQTCSRR